MKLTLALIATVFLAVAVSDSQTARASSADACTLNGGSIYAECMGSYSYHTSEDYSTSTGCMGACGPACNYNCDGDGPGGACYEHDLATRTYGMFSSQAMSKFPPALRKWASCMTGRYITTPATNIFSRVTSAVGWGWNKLSGLAW